MASPRRMVRFPGTLHGQGEEAACTVSAMEVTNPGGGAVAYCRHSVESVSKALPDGDYQLLANGETVPLYFSNGNWLSRN
jgi:hypothetical protein